MIISIAGGLGNQMFQYAYLLSQKERYPEQDVLADLSFFDVSEIHNGYELEQIFGISMPKCSRDISERYRPSEAIIYRVLRKVGMYYAGYKYTIRDKASGFDERFLNKFDTKDYLFGFWQSEKYFKDIKQSIIKAFHFPNYCNQENIRIANEMHNLNSIAIHVRRGDYLKNKMFINLSEVGYYERAIAEIKNLSLSIRKWYIFSDDISWCIDNLPLIDENVEYVNWNTKEKSYQDMQLMTECKYVIVANSSFSWWGAYLNQNATAVIAPKEYYVNNPGFNKDVCPEEWIRC